MYIGNLHTDHKQTVLMMFDAGKAVLCEKPLTCSSQDTLDLLRAAREKNIFFMEVCSVIHVDCSDFQAID